MGKDRYGRKTLLTFLPSYKRTHQQHVHLGLDWTKRVKDIRKLLSHSTVKLTHRFNYPTNVICFQQQKSNILEMFFFFFVKRFLFPISIHLTLDFASDQRLSSGKFWLKLYLF